MTKTKTAKPALNPPKMGRSAGWLSPRSVVWGSGLSSEETNSVLYLREIQAIAQELVDRAAGRGQAQVEWPTSDRSCTGMKEDGTWSVKLDGVRALQIGGAEGVDYAVGSALHEGAHVRYTGDLGPKLRVLPLCEGKTWVDQETIKQVVDGLEDVVVNAHLLRDIPGAAHYLDRAYYHVNTSLLGSGALGANNPGEAITSWAARRIVGISDKDWHRRYSGPRRLMQYLDTAAMRAIDASTDERARIYHRVAAALTRLCAREKRRWRDQDESSRDQKRAAGGNLRPTRYQPPKKRGQFVSPDSAASLPMAMLPQQVTNALAAATQGQSGLGTLRGATGALALVAMEGGQDSYTNDALLGWKEWRDHYLPLTRAALRAHNRRHKVSPVQTGRLDFANLHRCLEGRAMRRIVKRDLDLAVALLVDASGSMEGYISRLVGLADAMRLTLAELGAQVIVVLYDTTPFRCADPWRAGVFYPRMGGGTVTCCALDTAAGLLLRTGAIRKVLVHLTDGDSTACRARGGRHYLEDLDRAIRRRGVFTIHFGVGEAEAVTRYQNGFYLGENLDRLGTGLLRVASALV